MLKNILSHFRNLKSKKPENDDTERCTCPTIVVEESFIMKGRKCDATFRISLEVPVPISVTHPDKEEIERVRRAADGTFRPIVVVLRHYLWGLCQDDSPERFLIGRDNLVAAIKQCALLQLKSIEESEKNS